jgi:hypothetical protein
MARRPVDEIKCDRCGKTETQEPHSGTNEAELTIRFSGEEVVYEDLCNRCRKACENYFKSITKQIEKEAKEEDSAPPAPEPQPEPPPEPIAEKKRGGLFGGRKS